MESSSSSDFEPGRMLVFFGSKPDGAQIWFQVSRKRLIEGSGIVSRNRLMTLIRNLLREEDGPTAVEYAVMLSLIVGGCIGAVHALAQVASQSFTDSSDAINSAVGP